MSESFLRGRRMIFGASTSRSLASRFARIFPARSTTAAGSPAIAATWMPNDFSATPGLADCLRITVGRPEECAAVVEAFIDILSLKEDEL